MIIPTEHEWKTEYPECLDYKSARKSFLGLSREQAYKLFSYNALYYQEELNVMPLIPFEYYLKPFLDYLLSGDSKGDCDGASSFLMLLEWKLKEEPDMLSNVYDSIMVVARHISIRQDFYDANEDIYGNFLSQYEHIKSLTRKLEKW